MSILASDLNSAESAALRSMRAYPEGALRGERSENATPASADRERRVRAEARWRRVVYVCGRELLRRDAEPGRGGR
jgi:hypothetical protein